MEPTTYIAFFAVAFIIALGIFPIIIRVAKKMNLTEQNDERKLHTEKISSLGGIGVLLACAITILFFMQPVFNSSLVAFALVLPLFIIGLLDDLYTVGVTIRFAIQALLGILLYEMGFRIIHIENLWWANMAANVFFIMLMVNAYNFIDGINGLAGGLGLIGSLVMGGMLAAEGLLEVALFCFAYAGSLLGFLCFNFGKKAQIFMGDNGSTVMGYFMAVMILAFMKTNMDTIQQMDYSKLLGVVAVPISDIFKVSLFRVFRGQSPFSADRTHIHHLFTDGVLSHPAACAVLMGWTLITVYIADYLVGQAMAWPLMVVLLGMPYLLAKWARETKMGKKEASFSVT